MSNTYYYVVVEELGKTYNLESYVKFELAVRHAIETNLRTGARPKVLYHTSPDISDFEVWPLNGLAGEYMR